MATENKGVKVKIESTKYFRNQEGAREYAIKCLQSGVTFIKIYEWVEDVEDPAPVEPEPPEPKKEPKRKKPGFEPRKKRKYSQEVIDYIKEAYPNSTATKLIPRVNKMFGLDLNDIRIKSLIKDHGLTKKALKKKGKGLKSEDGLDKDVDEMDLD